MLNSFKELCIMRAVAVNSLARVLNPLVGEYICIQEYIYIYIYCHPETDCFVLSELGVSSWCNR